MQDIFALILIFERNKIIFIIEFVYYKFEIMVIFFFYSLVDRISCFNNDRIKSSRASIS